MKILTYKESVKELLAEMTVTVEILKDAIDMLEMYMQLPKEVRERIKYMTEGAALVTQSSAVMAVSAEETA